MVDLDVNSKLLEKLQKIKSLQQSPNEEEVVSATIMLKKFLDKYGLSESDIPAIESKSLKPSKLTDEKVEGRRLYIWEKLLASAIARLYDCKAAYSYSIIHFYGFEPDLTTTKEMYKFVREALRNIALKEARNQKHSTVARYVKCFMDGAIERLDKRVYKIIADREANKPTEEYEATSALVVVKENAIAEMMQHVTEVTLSLPEPGDVEAYLSGYKTGDSISLDKQIEND